MAVNIRGVLKVDHQLLGSKAGAKMRVFYYATPISAEATRRVKTRVAPRGALMVGASTTAMDATRLRPATASQATEWHAAS